MSIRPTSIPVKSSSSTTLQASSPIPSGVTLPSLPGVDVLDDILESRSGQSYTTVVSSAKQPLFPSLLSSKPLVNITSSPTYTAIVLSNNELDLREHDRGQSWFSMFLWMLSMSYSPSDQIFLIWLPFRAFRLQQGSLVEIWDTVQTAYVSYFLKYPIVYHQIYF